MTRAEVDSKMKKLGSKDYTLLRMKGWGETNPDQLNELCLNPESRHLMHEFEDIRRNNLRIDILFFGS